jgi:hypothetical protein
MRPSAALFLAFAPVAHAYLGISNVVECYTIVEANGKSFDACATWSMEMPAQTMLPNGTVFYEGLYKNEYTITKGFLEGTDTCAFYTDPVVERAHSTGIKITVQRQPDDTQCQVTVKIRSNSKKCSKCVYCGNDLYSVDCSMIQNGRSVTCEATGEGAVFFPLTSAALANRTVTKAPILVRAPVKAPVKAPKQAAARAPVVAPKQPKLRAPVSAPKQVVRAPVKANPKQVRPPALTPFSALETAPVMRAPVQAPKRVIGVAPPIKAPRVARPPASNIFKRVPVKAAP